MHLKALEIQGFKSFPDKTSLSFDDADITAIVGPNGSGKSNISDAIRWVMGEQSTRALRGGKMEDVIFGGTQERRGQGFAQVSLTLDNEDGHLPMEGAELVVTRRYYRSGESEYYINRHLVRLRDINELFMDTGLGQEGYSLIGQGKIDEILSVKSTQRREIFEEAAGISRYRHRKEEAERKLERTRENLLRIGDKIEELELQVEPLRAQADKAKRYFACQEELRIVELSLWMDRLGRLRQEHSQVREAHAAMSRQLEEVKAETEGLYAASEALSAQAQEKEAEIEKTRHGSARLEEEGAACDSRISVLQERVKNNRENILRLREEREAQLSRGNGLEEQMQTRQAALAQLAGEEDLCRTSLESLGRQILAQEEARADVAQALGKLTEQAQLETNSAGRIRSLISALEASAQEVVDREASLQQNLEEVKAQGSGFAAQEEELQAQLCDLEARQRVQEKTTAQARAAAEGCNRLSAEAEEDWVSLRMEENALLARIRMLEEMEKLYEGYSRSVKTVMEEAKSGRLLGLHGPVAGLVKVPEAYTVAIEISLGGAMQNLVVETEKHGKAVLEYLKRSDGGRVTCLPMNTIRPGRLEDRGFSRTEGYLGIASDLVEYEEKYKNIISNLLGKVAVVRDLDSGIAMARQYGNRFRIVTLDGQVLTPGGAMTGGSVNKKSGILSRAKELEKLHGKQKTLKTKRAEAQTRLDEAKQEAARAQGALEAAEEHRRGLEDALLVLKGKREGQMAQTEGLRRQEERLLDELGQLGEKTAETQDRSSQALERIAQLEQAALHLSEKRETLLEEQEALMIQGEELAKARQELETKLAVFETERRVSAQSRLELQALRETLTADYQRQSGEIARIQRETEALLVQCEEEAARWQQLQGEREACREALESLGREKLEIEAKRGQADRDGRRQNETLLYCQRETTVLEQKKLGVEQEEASLLDKMWETYEMTHQGALAICVPVEDRGRAERRVSTLKGEIRSLGNVNLGAVEEFQRVSERYEYLQDQRQDVEEAAARLLAIIEEITGEMKAIFAREFVRINQAFGDTFVKLFQGGKASLHLEDEEDILNCGIEIRVQPPGKSLKHLSLLSGGEKAFVAIALYFAILQVRPTPFCVLDEIEAALDDVNVLRFARYLRSISDKTQFIVITHRRGTMEEADVLYGVTMEDQGVSRLLRLNLNEAEQALKEPVGV